MTPCRSSPTSDERLPLGGGSIESCLTLYLGTGCSLVPVGDGSVERLTTGELAKKGTVNLETIRTEAKMVGIEKKIRLAIVYPRLAVYYAG